MCVSEYYVYYVFGIFLGSFSSTNNNMNVISLIKNLVDKLAIAGCNKVLLEGSTFLGGL